MTCSVCNGEGLFCVACQSGAGEDCPHGNSYISLCRHCEGTGDEPDSGEDYDYDLEDLDESDRPHYSD